MPKTALPETPVAILQHPQEFAGLLELYRHRRPKRVLEIGVGAGGTLYHWLRNAPPGALVVAIDRFDQLDYRGMFTAWKPTEVRLKVISGDSSDPDVIARARALGPFDWIFIDADHHDAAVRADWANYKGLTTRGAIVALHDIAPSDDPTIEVDQLWSELADGEHFTLELVEPGGFGIGVVLIEDES